MSARPGVSGKIIALTASVVILVVAVVGVVVGRMLYMYGWPTANPHQYGIQVGPQSASLTSPDNVTFQVVTIQHDGTRWLFHFHARNNSNQDVTLWRAGSDHFFTLGGVGVAGKAYTGDQLFLRLAKPAGTDVSSYAALPATINAGGAVDGWLVADFSHFAYPSDGNLYYIYGTVTTPACSHPVRYPWLSPDCHPATGYRTLVWRLS